MGERGASGVKLPTNARGLDLGAPELDPLMAVLDKRKAVVVLHPHRPEPFNAKLAEGLPLAMYEYHAETTRALTRLFARNVPARYPNIRFIVPHAGAFLPLALPRMKAVHTIVRAKGLADGIDWEANMKSLWFDLAGSATAENVRRLLEITTADHILYGSDFPYAPAESLWRRIFPVFVPNWRPSRNSGRWSREFSAETPYGFSVLYWRMPPM